MARLVDTYEELVESLTHGHASAFRTCELLRIGTCFKKIPKYFWESEKYCYGQPICDLLYAKKADVKKARDIMVAKITNTIRNATETNYGDTMKPDNFYRLLKALSLLGAEDTVSLETSSNPNYKAAYAVWSDLSKETIIGFISK